MKINNNYLVGLGIVVVITLTTVINTQFLNNEKDRLDENNITQLEKNILLIESENSILNKKIKSLEDENISRNSKQSEISVTTKKVDKQAESDFHESVHADENNDQDTELTKSDEHGLNHDNVDTAGIEENINDAVDITKPFNGIDPASTKQQDLYTSFKYEIDGYNYNERFDMKSFLSDPRFSELHASLGVKLLDYVDAKLTGVSLLQHTDPDFVAETDH